MKVLTYDNRELDIPDTKLAKSGLISEMMGLELEGEEIPLTSHYCDYDTIFAIFLDEINYETVEINLLVKIIRACDYLDIPDVLDKTTTEIAKRIKNSNSSQEVQDLFKSIETYEC